MPGDRRTPNERLRARRLQRGWSQQDLADAVIEVGNREGERNLGLTLDQVSRWERGLQHPKPPYTKLLCLVFRATAQELGLYLEHNEANPSSGEGEEATERRDFLRLGLAATAAPAALAWVLTDAAAEAMAFTRRSGTSAVGPATFDHLEAVLVHLDRAYHTDPAPDLFRMARAYRAQVQEMIEGPHTLSEGRELYVYAGWLSQELAWVTHDLGSRQAAEAYAIDAYRHAEEAGNTELCASAMDAMSSIAFYDRRPERAFTAARKGMSMLPARHPLGVRLRAKAGRALARLGDRQRCEDLFADARDLYERLPANPVMRFYEDMGPLAAQAMAGLSASASVSLADFETAKERAEEALSLYRSLPVTGNSHYWEAISRIDRGIALAALGSPDEAVAEGRGALASPRVVDSVLSRAGDLDSALTARHPDLPEARDYHEQYRETARKRALQTT